MARLDDITYRARLYNLLERQVHPCIAVDKVAIKRLSILELDQHRVALGSVEKAEGQLLRDKVSGDIQLIEAGCFFARAVFAAPLRAVYRAYHCDRCCVAGV